MRYKLLQLVNKYYLEIKRKLKQMLRKSMIQIFDNPLVNILIFHF